MNSESEPSEALLETIRAHIPADAPELDGFVTGYYFECECGRTEKHIRYSTRDWWTQTDRRRRVPVLDADGMEIDSRPSADWRDVEPLDVPILRLDEVRAHPKPWLGPHDDAREGSGAEGDYCWECAEKIHKEIFAKRPKGANVCDCICHASDARGCCVVCGVMLEGEPEDLDQELGHWLEYPPDDVRDWQELERLVEKFDYDLDHGKKADKLLKRFRHVVETGEEYAWQSAANPIRALAFLWESRTVGASGFDAPIYQQCAAELIERLDAGNDPKELIQSWSDRDDVLKAIRVKYQGRRWEDLTAEEQAEQHSSNGHYTWGSCASELNGAMYFSAGKRRKYLRAKRELPVPNPRALREALAQKYYRDSLRGPPEKSNPARHKAVAARKTFLWQYLLKEFGRETAQRWVAELTGYADRLDASAAESELNQQDTWNARWAATDRAIAVKARAEAAEIETWIATVEWARVREQVGM